MKLNCVFYRLLPLAALFGCFLAGAAQNQSLAEAYKILSAKQFVDLTHSFSPLTPVWKGFGQATFSSAADPETGRPYTIAQDGFRASFYSLVGQIRHPHRSTRALRF